MEKILKNLSWNLTGKLFRISLNVVILAKIIQFIGYEKFGLVTLLLTYQSYFAIISTLGAEVNYGKTLVQGIYSDMFLTLFAIKLVMTCVALFLFFLLGSENLLLLTIFAGGLATFNLIDIELSAQHLHKKFIKISLVSSFISFAIKYALIEYQKDSMLIYFLILENLIISMAYFPMQVPRLKLTVNFEYVKHIAKTSIQFLFQRLLFVMSTTILLLLFSGKVDALDFGKIALSFKIVGFLYIVVAAMSSSFEKSIFGRNNKLVSFSNMYRTNLLFYFVVIMLFPVAAETLKFLEIAFADIYFNFDNYIAIVLSLPYFFMVSLNKWYILNREYRILLYSSAAIIASMVFFATVVSHPSKTVFWVIWSACFSFGILIGFFLDNKRKRHLRVLRRSLWPVSRS